MRVSPSEFERLDLRIHSLLRDVPLHDVWAVDLPDGDRVRTLADLRSALSFEQLSRASPAVRLLFGTRRALGRFFSWDSAVPHAGQTSFLERLSDSDRRGTAVTPGTREGPFRVLYAFDREAASEIRNATVHAVSCFALVAQPGLGHRLYWAIYVAPVGRLTAWYMRLIDPFRRRVVYPAMLRAIRAAWARSASTRRDSS